MFLKKIVSGSFLSILVLSSNFVLVETASAGKFCAYYASSAHRVVADGKATARSMSTACRRAKRRCNRELRRKRRRHEVPRNTTGCRRVTH